MREIVSCFSFDRDDRYSVEAKLYTLLLGVESQVIWKYDIQSSHHCISDSKNIYSLGFGVCIRELCAVLFTVRLFISRGCSSTRFLIRA